MWQISDFLISQGLGRSLAVWFDVIELLVTSQSSVCGYSPFLWGETQGKPNFI